MCVYSFMCVNSHMSVFDPLCGSVAPLPIYPHTRTHTQLTVTLFTHQTLNFCLYKLCAMCLSWLHFQPCAGSEPNCNCCCLSNKYTYMQLRSPEVTRVNFHLTV